MTLNAQIVGNVGLYFACYHLSLLGWNVMPTAWNARGVDVIAYNVLGTRYIRDLMGELEWRRAQGKHF